jgi:hypothetical protein
MFSSRSLLSPRQALLVSFCQFLLSPFTVFSASFSAEEDLSWIPEHLFLKPAETEALPGMT